jgi:alginate O-acetyltransferase complex protein AlgI
MLFCTYQFAVYFAAVFAAYWATPWHRARVWLLLAASGYFYACWNPWLAWIIGVSATLDYALARGMAATTTPGRRKALLLVSLAANLGLLAYFKYANFFLDSLETALRAAGADVSLPVLQVILPIGISFYTFEAINYTVDVYRRKIRAERDLGNFVLFILFFPHLVAGPIVRAADFLPQVRRRKRWSWPRLHLGVRLVLLGVVKKLAVADRMALYADPVFADPAAYNTGAAWLAVLAYSLQIYCDFSAYTDIALGTAQMLGYRLAENFHMPYLAANVSEFWRRWHISLSTWLRDYVFMPLTLRGAKRRAAPVGRVRAALTLLTGGQRGTRWRAYSSLLATMTLCGLWHGASWPYVASGVLHGLLLVVHRVFEECCGQRPRLAAALQTGLGTAARVAVTFVAVSLIWVVFRSPTFGVAGAMFARLAGPHEGLGVPLPNIGLWLTVAAVAIGHALTCRGRWDGLLAKLPAPVRGLGLAAALTLALVLAPEADKAFIYFQF